MERPKWVKNAIRISAALGIGLFSQVLPDILDGLGKKGLKVVTVPEIVK